MFRTGQLLANYWNPDFNALLEDARTNMDPKKRLRFYSQASRFFLDDPPAIPLYQQIDNYGVNRKLQWSGDGGQGSGVSGWNGPPVPDL
jgi:peptide/nickel transport system substrate-binding protein